MPRVFQAEYTSYYRFNVPKYVMLLDEDDVKNDGVTPGSWWVKWGTFYYIDAGGAEREIEGVDCSEHKRPISVEEVEEEETDDEEEEEEEETTSTS